MTVDIEIEAMREVVRAARELSEYRRPYHPEKWAALHRSLNDALSELDDIHDRCHAPDEDGCEIEAKALEEAALALEKSADAKAAMAASCATDADQPATVTRAQAYALRAEALRTEAATLRAMASNRRGQR